MGLVLYLYPDGSVTCARSVSSPPPRLSLRSVGNPLMIMAVVTR